MIDYDLIPSGEGVPKMVTVSTLARWLGISTTSVRNWTRDGVLPTPVNLRRRKTLYNVEEVRQRLKDVIEGRWTTREGGRNGKG